MDRIARNVLVVGLLAATADPVWAAGDGWSTTFDTGPRFVNESQIEPTGLILSTTPRSKTLFSGAIGRSLGSSPLDVDRATVEGLGSERLGWNVGAGLEPDTSTRGLMANRYFDFRSSSRFTPTIGGGIGFVNSSTAMPGSLGYTVATDEYPVFMFRFEATLGYEFSESVRGSLGYRLLGSGQSDLTEVLSVPFSSEWDRDQALEIGVHINF